MHISRYLGIVLLLSAFAGLGSLFRVTAHPEKSDKSSADYEIASTTHLPNGVQLSAATRHDTSPPLRSLKPRSPAPSAAVGGAGGGAPFTLAGHHDAPDPLVQRAAHPAGSAAH